MYCYHKFKHIIILKSKYVLHETDIVPNLYFYKKYIIKQIMHSVKRVFLGGVAYFTESIVKFKKND